MSNTMTPTVWLRLLRRERANWLGRYPSFCAARSMRFFVTAGMYRASGALFSTIDTVVEENPLSFATSRIVTIATFAPEQSAPQFGIYVGTAALGCPVEQSSAISYIASSSDWTDIGLLARRTAEGGCPHITKKFSAPLFMFALPLVLTPCTGGHYSRE